MAEFKFNCPQCNQKIEADESLRGQVAECPHCGKGIVVPRAAAKPNGDTQNARENRSASRKSQGFTFKCSHCKQAITVEESARGKLMGCPHCGMRIVVPRIKFPREGDINECPSKETGSVMHHRYVVCEGMLFDCATSDSGCSEEGNFPQKNKERMSRRRLGQTYICTHCGENVSKPIKIRGKLLGCFYMLLGLLLGAGLTLASPIIGIAIAVIFLVMGCVVDAQGNRMKCPKCGKLDTMIPATSPQGRRLLKETGSGYGMIDSSSSVPRRQRIWTGQDDGMMYPSSPLLVQPQQQEVSERLSKMQKLLDGGLISTEEYEIQRKRILESI